MPILEDFKANQKTQEITIQSVRSELIACIEGIAKEYDLTMGNRFYHCDFDEVRDLTISKRKFKMIEDDA
jgi:hypothetical protein